MLLRAKGVDIATIALWLGHESTQTTHIYEHADPKLKEQAIAEPPRSGPSPADTDHPTRSSRSSKRYDYVERTPRQTALSRRITASEPALNITVRGTYNRTCPFPGIRLKQAVEVRWRDGRTIRSLWSVSSSGPFTTTVAVASNLSVGSGRHRHLLLTGLT